MTLSCRDADALPKVANAGKIVEQDGQLVQVMHNGVKVVAGGYYGDWMADIIRGLRGHHEPQEELVFHHLLRFVRQKSVFVELGSFWAYYSNWYLAEVFGSRALCIEPDLNNMAVGQANINACVGGEYRMSVAMPRESDRAQVHIPCFCMTNIVEAANTPCIEVLHMDVQGAELAFVSSMNEHVRAGRVRFLIVSTHHECISGSATTHQDCVSEIERMGGIILCEHTIGESYSGDGLIVASFFQGDQMIRLPEISRNRTATSLFRS
jgi:hypothetical protein